MKEFLKKLKLIDYLTTELHISINEFVDKLNAIVDKSDFGFFSNTFDAFSSSKNELKGQINYSGFKIKRRRKFFDSNMNFAVATGTFYEERGILRIQTEINGFRPFIIPFYIVLIIFYSAFFLITAHARSNTFFVFPFLIVHAAFMFGIPYFIMRRSVKRLKYDLEREFYYLTKK
jgi:hypothetical protein